jgi:hypothetical protein
LRTARYRIARALRLVCALFARFGAAVAFCDVSDVPADAVTVDALARLQLGAKRSCTGGCASTQQLRKSSRSWG